MEEVIGGNIYKAYQKLPIKVMKADLWRYCVIYEYGGIYADTDTVCKIVPSIFINNSMLTIVPENSSHLCQWVFSAPAKSPILREEIKGEHIIHYLTGPALFTDGIENYLKKNNKPVFLDKKLYHNYPDSSILKVFNCDIFHKNMVKHLFTGQDNDGWCKERNEKLLK
jgi:mannosyltransferase OCH1-like enzyme